MVKDATAPAKTSTTVSRRTNPKTPSNPAKRTFKKSPRGYSKQNSNPRNPRPGKKNFSKGRSPGGRKPANDKGEGRPKARENPLKKAYSNLARSIKNKELCLQRVSEFLKQAETDMLKTVGKLLGSKGLQLCLKYGNIEQRRRLMLNVMSLDVEKVIRSKYSYYLLRKMLKQPKNHAIKKLLLTYFEKNFPRLFKSKATFKFADLYLISLKESQKLQLVNKVISTATYDEFAFQEFVDACLAQPRLLEMPLSQLYIHQYFAKLDEERRGKLVITYLKQLDYVMKQNSWPGVLLLCDLFRASEFKLKKEIMKKCLKEAFWTYYTTNKYFLLFVAVFLSLVNEPKLVGITLSKRIIENFAGFFDSSQSMGLLYLLFARKPESVFLRDRNGCPSELLELFVTKLETSAIFIRNRDLIILRMIDEPEILNELRFVQVYAKIQSNSQFSLLYGHIFEAFAKRPEAAEFFGTFATHLSETVTRVATFSNTDFLGSSAGHRFVKRLIQSLGQAHQDVVEKTAPAIDNLVDYLNLNLELILPSKAIFVLVALIENSSHSEALVDSIRQKEELLKGLPMSSGVKLLRGLIQE